MHRPAKLLSCGSYSGDSSMAVAWLCTPVTRPARAIIAASLSQMMATRSRPTLSISSATTAATVPGDAPWAPHAVGHVSEHVDILVGLGGRSWIMRGHHKACLLGFPLVGSSHGIALTGLRSFLILICPTFDGLPRRAQLLACSP